eukprot:6462548-Amphidinium_carterae.1
MASKATATKVQSARAKLAFQPGQLTAILKKHMTVIQALRADTHVDIQQQLIGELLLDMRRASSRVTAGALVEAMKELSCKPEAKTLAAACIITVWQRVLKRLKYATSGARLSDMEKAFRDLEG